MITSRPGRGAARLGLYGVLTSWLALTAAAQFSKRPQFLRRIDPLNTILPLSTFFAPRPGSTDTHVLQRDRLADGTVTEWTECVLNTPRSIQHMIWHPGMRGEKAVFDAATELLQLVHQERRVEYLQLSFPYLMLLNFITHQCEHLRDARQVQFLLVDSAGFDESQEPTIMFASEFHDLPERRRAADLEIDHAPV